MADLVLAYDQRRAGAGAAHVLRLSHPDLPPALADPGIEFIDVGADEVDAPTVLDGYLNVALFLAMQAGVPLRVEGALSTRAVRNAHAWQEYWNCWAPGRYRVVDVLAERVVPDAQWRGGARSGRSISAFSGGVDATYTLLRHSRSGLGPSSYPLTDALMVHGLDVPPGNVHAFDRLTARVQRLVDEIGVALRVVRTDCRQLLDPLTVWHHTHGAMISACLHQFARTHDYGLIAASQNYDGQLLAWGSNPMSDPLMSGGCFEIVHDGAGTARAEKVAVIASNPIASATVKVCWQGPDPARNCGTCEKCVRTRLCFAAAGVEDPACFDTPFDPSVIDDLVCTNYPQFVGVESALHLAQRQPTPPSWVPRLESRVAQMRIDLGLG